MTKHSFSLSLEDEDYQALKALAEREDRHIYEQARHMLRRALAKPLAERIGEALGDLHDEDYVPHRCCGAPVGGPHQIGCAGDEPEHQGAHHTRTHQQEPLPG